MSTNSFSQRKPHRHGHAPAAQLQTRSGRGTLTQMFSALAGFINHSDRKLTDSGVIHPIAERVSVIATRRR
ncbi:hypothetical protein [Rhodopirellula sp. P2]|uniref:hypothetical protein n=1 Tax=Rhodopirellula sp. P2 TaxID=2127060 RepID=UPI0023680634|nr:hypothetical protein [Rhodopirellula sp. P2]WDQ15035.1 hypothetical protein PSR62_15470 [Rhodopirellula sp. P2]